VELLKQESGGFLHARVTIVGTGKARAGSRGHCTHGSMKMMSRQRSKMCIRMVGLISMQGNNAHNDYARVRFVRL
jgi:hypothetical protein